MVLLYHSVQLNDTFQPQIMVSQKTLTPRPHSSSKSPLQGWTEEDRAEKDTTVSNGIVNDKALHESTKGDSEELKGQNVFITNGGESGEAKEDQGNEETEAETKADNNQEGEKQDDTNNNETVEKVTADIDDLVVVTESERKFDDGREGGKGIEEVTSVHKTEETSEASDKDKTEVETEDYLGK